MRIHRFTVRFALAFSFIAAASMCGQATEYASSTYGPGESTFSAGVTPPLGNGPVLITKPGLVFTKSMLLRVIPGKITASPSVIRRRGGRASLRFGSEDEIAAR
jgi:hypothetical protein